MHRISIIILKKNSNKVSCISLLDQESQSQDEVAVYLKGLRHNKFNMMTNALPRLTTLPKKLELLETVHLIQGS